MSYFVISQALVTTAIVFDIASFQFKSREKLIACFLASSLLLSAHFFVLGQSSGGALYLLTFLRFLTAYFSKNQIWIVIYLLLAFGIFVITYQEIFSVFAFIGALASTYGAFQKNDRRIRIFMFIGTISWLVFNCIIFSPMAVLRQSIFAISNIIGYWRFYSRNPQTSKID